MNNHQFLEQAAERGWLKIIDKAVHPVLEMAAVAYALDGWPLLFTNVTGSDYRVVSGLASDRKYFALALACEPGQISFRLADAFRNPRKAPIHDSGVCQEVIEQPGDLLSLPFLKHWPDDAGHYATAAVAIIRDPDTGLNASYHRLLRLDAHRCAARLVERRGTHTAWQKSPEGLPVSICIGLPLHVLLAASLAPKPGISELDIAHALQPTPLVQCITNDLLVPADSEFVLEGRISHELVPEGPFVDLTETIDIVRMQPVIEIDCISHRQDALYHALLPGHLEHKLLMGMPKEPSIYAATNNVVTCLNVNITPGGTSWLHAIVQIDKQHPDDGKKAIYAAYEGHPSLKHVVIVDKDIDIFTPSQVEWAIATRFQAGRDGYILRDQPSSSLDPSALHRSGQKSRTDKMGLDATIPWDTPQGPSHPQHFKRVPIPAIDPQPYLANPDPGRGKIAPSS
ncbi:MAG: UbiD family decarboxylase [Chloroflexi bacterium]|nr:UbiD family decarboxylase [Chloroflexota bacterium]